MTRNIDYQQGFTLIELMISLVLGLLISAAVIQVFVTSQRVDRIQTAGSEIQDKAVFGLQSIEPQIRLANLGNDGVTINDTTFRGGIVLTASETTDTNVIAKPLLRSGYLTRSGDMESIGNASAKWNGELSNTEVPSDQLTIQYINTTGRKIYDCEGQEIKPNDHVITRYFITEGVTGANVERKSLNLSCNAGRIKDNNDSDDDDEDKTDQIKKFGKGKSGQTIIENIDQFNIRLGVQQDVTSADGKISYEYADMTVKDYMVLTDTKPPIINIRIAILARSTANSPEASGETFLIFGKEQTLKTQTNALKYLRRVYESNILLRNARVMSIIDSSSAP